MWDPEYDQDGPEYLVRALPMDLQRALEQRFMPYAAGNVPPDLDLLDLLREVGDRQEDLERRLWAARWLHHPTIQRRLFQAKVEVCAACAQPWPCTTRRALDGDWRPPRDPFDPTRNDLVPGTATERDPLDDFMAGGLDA